MRDPDDSAPPPDSPPLNGYARPAQRRGAARGDAVPRMETVRVTAPDLTRRAALEKTRGRLVIAAFGFGVPVPRRARQADRRDDPAAAAAAPRRPTRSPRCRRR